MSTTNRITYLDDHRPCGECGHSTGAHWTADTASFACTRPGCGCAGWWSMADCAPDDDSDEDRDDEDGSTVLPGVLDRPGWVGPPVVTLCGSMRFWPLMVTVAAAETAAGVIVLAPFVIVGTGEQNTDRGDGAGRGLKVRLDALHRAKITMSSSVLVVTDHTGYWGESTRDEIEYALSLGLPVGVREVDRSTGAQTTHGPLTGSWAWSR